MSEETSVIDPPPAEANGSEVVQEEPKPKARRKVKSPDPGSPAKRVTKDVARKAVEKAERDKERSLAAFRATAMVLHQAADPTRLQVLMLLADGEHNVGEICAAISQHSQPAVSHHLALLRHGRLIQPRRDGKNNFYSLTDEGRKLVEGVRGLIDG